MITTVEKKPLFADLGELARTITWAIENARAQGVEAKAVHINPGMLEVMGQMAGITIVKIGQYPIVADSTVPLERFRLRKY